MQLTAFNLALLAFTASPVLATDPPFIQNLVLYWDYGRSPPVYPSPNGTGTDIWANSYAQAKALVAQMTNEEKQNVTIGYASYTNGCSGNSPGVPRLGYPGMCLNDAGNGARGVEGTSGYPSGVHVGASWNRDLALSRGQYMGAEFKAKGVNVALGPVVGPMGRVAEGGRNWEGQSNDPYLNGVLAAQSINGLQQNVIACVKHYICNEQESNRFPLSELGLGYNASVSSNLDDKTMHELYLWPFQDAVRAGAGSVMASYNRINNSYGSQNSKILNGLLKTELGFQGLVVSDWGAQHSGVASANAGLDMVMPTSNVWLNLSMAVANGSVAQSRLDDMATRILATWYQYASFENPGYGVPISVTAPHAYVNAISSASQPTLLQSAIEGHVLVKNVKKALPLQNPRFISLFGYDGIVPRVQNPGYTQWTLGFDSTNVTVAEDYPVLLGLEQAPSIAIDGTMWVGGGSGANTPPFVVDPFQAFTARARANPGTYLTWDFSSPLPTVDQASDVCIVFINAFSTEGSDRSELSDAYSDNLVNGVASQCNNTMVVIHNAGIRIVDGFYSNPNVTAIIYAHLPGQESGNALISLLYGEQSFSGRLPYTVGKAETDYGSLLQPTKPSATSDYYTQSNFTEGVYIDYKSFIKRGVTPRFPFGYGLTYSSFKYSNLGVSMSSSGTLPSLPPSAATLSGGNPHLFDTIATVTATVANTGKVAAAEVAQLYVGIPGAPPKQLRGFVKQLMSPGMSAQVSFALTRRDLSVWDVVQQQWVLQSGSYNILVGKSVLDIQLKTQISLTTS